MSEQEITIHTDGSCLSNPGPGGWGAVLRRYKNGIEIKRREVHGNASMTTNNKMEMIAAIRGLHQIKRDEPAIITVFSDSQLLIRGMNEWVPKWQAQGWRKANRKTVENIEIWKELIAVSDGLKVRWQWVRGHNGDARNEEVDAIASAAAFQACDHV